MYTLKCCAGLTQMTAWNEPVSGQTTLAGYSLAKVPPGVKLAYLQVEEEEEPELLDLLFVVRRLKRYAKRVGLPKLCDHQADNRENCGHCGKCRR